MKKQEFLRKLSSHLGKMPKEDRDDIMADFEEYFLMAQSENESEEVLCKRLGDPKKIAKEYYVQSVIEEANQKKSFKSMSRAFAASAGLGIANFFYVLCVVVVGYIVISSLYITACSIGISGLATIAASLIFGYSYGAILVIGFILCGIALIAVGVLMFIGIMQLAKLFRKANMRFLNMTKRGIKGRYEQ